MKDFFIKKQAIDKKILTNKCLPFGSKVELLKKNKNLIMFEKNNWIKFNDICSVSTKNNNFKKMT